VGQNSELAREVLLSLFKNPGWQTPPRERQCEAAGLREQATAFQGASQELKVVSQPARPGARLDACRAYNKRAARRVESARCDVEKAEGRLSSARQHYQQVEAELEEGRRRYAELQAQLTPEVGGSQCSGRRAAGPHGPQRLSKPSRSCGNLYCRGRASQLWSWIQSIQPRQRRAGKTSPERPTPTTRLRTSAIRTSSEAQLLATGACRTRRTHARWGLRGCRVGEASLPGPRSVRFSVADSESQAARTQLLDDEIDECFAWPEGVACPVASTGAASAVASTMIDPPSQWERDPGRGRRTRASCRGLVLVLLSLLSGCAREEAVKGARDAHLHDALWGEA